MASYRELKAQHGFLGLCRSPELACTVTMQPIDAFDPDAAIIFADILLPAEPMGFTVDFDPGPKIGGKVRSRSDVEALRSFDPYVKLDYLYQALRLTRAELSRRDPSKALLGFAGAPWTMACYLVEQGPFKHFQGTQVFAANEPLAAELLLDSLTDVLTTYLLAQLECGADAVQLFDSWGGNLSLEDYRRWSLPYNQRIIQAVQRTGGKIILYSSGSAHLLPALAESGADAISIDWRLPIADAQRHLRGRAAVQGNMDPTHLFRQSEDVATEVRAMIRSIPEPHGYIANLGHGILPTTPPEHVQTFIETVKEGWQR